MAHLDFLQAAKCLENRRYEASKGDYGRLLIIGGSVGMSGAAFLSGLAAFRSGIGMVRYYGPEENRVILQTLLPEAMYTVEPIISVSAAAEKAKSKVKAYEWDDASNLSLALAWADYVIIGPGLSQSDSAKQKITVFLKEDLSRKKLVLFDADALNIIAKENIEIRDFTSGRSCSSVETNVVITPHVGEMSRLTGTPISTIKQNAPEVAAEYAKKHNCIVVLKDAETVIALPSGPVYKVNSGSAAMSKAGSGDVLTGVIAGMCAVLDGDICCGTVLGDYIHGVAGTIAGETIGVHSILAREIAESVPQALKSTAEAAELRYLQVL